VRDARLLARVRRVEDLDAVDAQGREAVDDRQDVVVVVEVPERVRPDGDAAGAVDQVDRVGDGRVRAAHEARRSRHEVGLEDLRGVGQALGREPLRVARVGDDRLGEVRAADRLAGGAARL
jgi:hypothetical protein